MPAPEPARELAAATAAPEPAVPVAPAPQPEEVKPRIEAVQIDPKEFLASAGLQMIETKPAAAAAGPRETEVVKLGRPRRERPRTAAEEALVQVETRK